MKPHIGIVMGDAAGIGPEIILKTLTESDAAQACRVTVLGSPKVMEKMACILRLSMRAHVLDCDVQPQESFQWKQASPINGANTLNALREAARMAGAGEVDGVVIGPLSKEALHLGGMREPDEGSFLRTVTGVPEVRLVVRWNDIFRTSVVGHVPFSQILSLLTTERIVRAVQVLAETMRDSGIPSPRIGVAAINPHAGEGGAFGDEESRVIEPAIAQTQDLDAAVSGPHPADTVFNRALRGLIDGIVFMHHDQGNAPMKTAAFGQGVIVYRGLPFPCTSVAHGPAYGRAGEGRADPGNFEQALLTAVKLASSP